MLDMIGMERIQDSQLLGRCVSSDLIEVRCRPQQQRAQLTLTQPKLFQPDDEFLLHSLLVTKGAADHAHYRHIFT
jgi:hypothetical protein